MLVIVTPKMWCDLGLFTKASVSGLLGKFLEI